MAVATALAIASGVAAAAGAGMSFSQTSKQNRLMSEAETAAAESMAQARKDLGKNYYKALSIQKEPYELSREGLLASAGMLTEAAKESERGAAETAGRIFLASQQGQGDIRAQMGQELMGLEKLTAQEESRLRDMNYNLSLQEAQGYQQMAADAQEAAARSTQQGFGALQTGIQQGIQMMPLYFKEREARGFGDEKLANPNKIGTVGMPQIAKTEAERNAAFNSAIYGSPMGNQLKGITNQSAEYPLYMQYPYANRMSINPFMIYQ